MASTYKIGRRQGRPQELINSSRGTDAQSVGWRRSRKLKTNHQSKQSCHMRSWKTTGLIIKSAVIEVEVQLYQVVLKNRRISDQLEKKQSNFAVLHDPRLGCPTAAAASTAIERKIPSWVDLEETMRDSPPRSVIWDINTERLPQRLSHSIGCTQNVKLKNPIWDPSAIPIGL